jgi:hypothetical protein
VSSDHAVGAGIGRPCFDPSGAQYFKGGPIKKSFNDLDCACIKPIGRHHGCKTLGKAGRAVITGERPQQKQSSPPDLITDSVGKLLRAVHLGAAEGIAYRGLTVRRGPVVLGIDAARVARPRGVGMYLAQTNPESIAGRERHVGDSKELGRRHWHCHLPHGRRLCWRWRCAENIALI